MTDSEECDSDDQDSFVAPDEEVEYDPEALQEGWPTWLHHVPMNPDFLGDQRQSGEGAHVLGHAEREKRGPVAAAWRRPPHPDGAPDRQSTSAPYRSASKST